MAGALPSKNRTPIKVGTLYTDKPTLISAPVGVGKYLRPAHLAWQSGTAESGAENLCPFDPDDPEQLPGLAQTQTRQQISPRLPRPLINKADEDELLSRRIHRRVLPGEPAGAH